MKKRSKKYNPNKVRVNPNSAFETITLSRPVSEDKRNKLDIGILGAIDAFTRGKAEKVHFDTLATTVDVCMMMSQNTFKRAYIEEINAARDGMIRCRERFNKINKLGLDGEALRAVKTLRIIHSEFIENVTGAEVKQFVNKRSDFIRSGNFYRGAAA
jgi:hypothetical protein